MSTLGTVNIAGLRGIRRSLHLPLGGLSLLLYGDNGSGKSSIVQALRLALTGSASSRAAEPLPAEFLRHRLEADSDASRVTIELKPGGTLELVGEQVTGDKAALAFRDGCVRANPFLRRDDLLAVVTDEPGARFKYFESFLDLETVDGLCRALAQRVKSDAERGKQLKADRDRALNGACAPLPSPADRPRSASALIAAYAGWGRRLGLALVEGADWKAVSETCAQQLSRAERPEVAVRRQALVVAQDRASRLIPPDRPSSVLGRLARAELEAREGELLPLLERALEALQRSDRATCPVCEQAVEHAELEALLRRRVAALADVRSLKQQGRELAQGWRCFLDDLESLERLAFATDSDPKPSLDGRALLEDLESSLGSSLSTDVLARLERVKAALDAELQRTPDERSTAELRQFQKAVLGASSSIADLKRAEADLAAMTPRAEMLRKVEKAVSDARKDVATQILERIGALVTRYYELIHPPTADDEVTGAPKAVVQRYKSGTALLRGFFNGEEVDDPRRLYSEGHLDTIGLCFFLALRRSRADREGPRDPRLMVLDDVVTSIDMGHARRIAELLRDEFKDHQILIFSHNEAFLRLCRGPLSQAKRLDIRRWTLEEGPKLAARVSHLDVLKRGLAESGDKITIAAAMMVLLDDFLDEATRALQLSVPQGRELTVKDCWDPLKKRLKELSKQGLFPGLEAILARIGEPGFFRNALAAHRNDWADDLSLSEVQAVAQALVDLVALIECTECRTIARPKMPHDPSAGFNCDCGKGKEPNFSWARQIPAPSSVEGA